MEADASASKSVSHNIFINTFQNVSSMVDLDVDQNSSPKGRRSASCGSSSHHRIGQGMSEIKAFSSFKSDQASIADWVELFGKNAEFAVDEGSVENLFKSINSEALECMPMQPELSPMVEGEESSHDVLNRAFIQEDSQLIMSEPNSTNQEESKVN